MEHSAHVDTLFKNFMAKSGHLFKKGKFKEV